MVHLLGLFVGIRACYTHMMHSFVPVIHEGEYNLGVENKLMCVVAAQGESQYQIVVVTIAEK